MDTRERQDLSPAGATVGKEGVCPGWKLPFEKVKMVAILQGPFYPSDLSCRARVTVDFSHSRSSPLQTFQSGNTLCRDLALIWGPNGLQL